MDTSKFTPYEIKRYYELQRLKEIIDYHYNFHSHKKQNTNMKRWNPDYEDCEDSEFDED